MTTSPIFVGTYRSEPKSLRPANASNPLVAFKAGASGSRVHSVSLASSDTAARDVSVYHGKLLTSASNMGTTAFTTGTLTRNSGSFVTDGWAVGDTALPSGSTTLSNDKLLTVTAVASGTLTFSETQTAETFASTALLYRVGRLTTHNVPATAGYVNSIPSVDGLGDNSGTVDDSPNRYVTLGANDCLAFASGATITAAKQIDIVVDGGDY